MGKRNVKEDIYNLKKIITKFVEPEYVPQMNLMAISKYTHLYKNWDLLGEGQPENFNPFEATLEHILYESNSRFRMQ
jgi:hypothetical protein